MWKIDIKVDVFPKQWEVLEVLFNQEKFSHLDELLIGWGWGWAKSFTGCLWLIIMCMDYPWINCWLGRADLNQLRLTTLQSFYEVANLLWVAKDFVMQQDPETKAPVIYYKRNWSKIFLLDLKHYPQKDPEFTKLWWLLLTICFIDELPEIIQKAYTIIQTRVWRRKNDEYWIRPMVLSSCNPVKNRVYRYFWKPRNEWILWENKMFIPMLAKDNPKLNKSYLKKLDNLPPWPERERLRNWNWEYDSTPWHLYAYNTLTNLFTNPITTGTKYIICDVATTGRDKAIIFVYDWRKLIDYKVFLKCSTTDLENQIKEFSQRYQIPMSQVLVDQAWEWKGIPSHLWCIGFVWGSSPIEEQVEITGDKFKPNYANLRTQCYFELQHHIAKMNLEIIRESEYRQEIVDDLDAIVEVDYDNDRKKKIVSKEEIKEKTWRSPDRWDVISMRCYFELKKDKFQIFV